MSDQIINITNIIPEDQIKYYVSPESEIMTLDGESWVYYNGRAICMLGRKKALENVWVHPEPGYNVGRCKMIKSTGDRCRNSVRPGWVVCRFHGAGTLEKSGGTPPTTGRFSSHLPTKLLANYEMFLADPQIMDMGSELAMIDTRMASVIQTLDTNDSEEAWVRVRSAYIQLTNLIDEIGDTRYEPVVDMLQSALESHTGEKEVWQEISKLIDGRRKVADTQRKYVESGKKYLTLPEANAMFAFIVDAVMRHVTNPKERQLIAEEMKIFSQK